ncbi:AcrR family transcriptional regulator [Paenibacillus sp. SORGH_AS306]|uniref:TetR/AcrR family transcriptional regulator n=1 Tax=unclassified Paenibacillus TaxID=185978 RepID=UPI002788FCD1|nr:MULTISPECIES: TetR/AcrR family transcriptional regulator [unclassified Paenibacillus]MDQ1234201.1 AcrR family transcriptional regulator [Paenibacillus sp. SORGH_AS_0306]MDR6111246.1 AcrR family transcriptional regulator [Paenibacillus sp. SORGH_AS_0338]
MNKKSPYHHGDLREKLILAGLELLSEGGVTGLDLRKVARKAGVSHAAPYRHFEDKSDLIAAVIEEGFSQLHDSLQRAVNMSEANTIDQLQNISLAYVEFTVKNPWSVREMFSGLTIDHNMYPSLYATSKKVFGLIENVIVSGQESGILNLDDSKELACVFLSTIHGTALLIIENHMQPITSRPGGTEHLARICVNALINGIKKT